MVTAFYVVFLQVFSREYPSGFTTSYRIGNRRPCLLESFGKWSEDPQKKLERKTASFLRPPAASPLRISSLRFQVEQNALTFDSNELNYWIHDHWEEIRPKELEKLGVKTDHPLQIETLFRLAWKCSRRLSLAVMFSTHWYKKHRLQGSVVWVQMNKRVDFLRNEGNISS